MYYTVKQVSLLTGVSIRTLHYYDEISLLSPKQITAAGYRLYDENELAKLQQILFFKELDFTLKEINEILQDNEFNQLDALENHRKLLIKKRERLDNIIKLVEALIKGEKNMEFSAFDRREIEDLRKEYKKEVQERWGDSNAYEQSKEKTKKYSKEDWNQIMIESEQIYKKFANQMDKSPCEKEVQELVKCWQDHITYYYYDCTKEILASLGEMYVSDERFTRNIDKYKEGLARFMSEAIRLYCIES